MEKRLIKKFQVGGEAERDNTYVSPKIDKTVRLVPKFQAMKFPSIPNPNFSNYVNFINQHEGKGIVTNNKDDKGGLTNTGITLDTWKTLGYDKNNDGNIDDKDLYLLTPNDRTYIIQKFWDMSSADKIKDPKTAMYVTDYVWGSGNLGFREMHKAFGLKPQNQMSKQLLDKINTNPDSLNILHNSRTSFYKKIAVGNQRKWLKGWLNRANDLFNL